MKHARQLLSYSLATSLVLLGLSARTASAKQYVLIVLDTTGSMGEAFSPTQTRLQKAQQNINDFLALPFPMDTEFALWFFSDLDRVIKVDFTAGDPGKAAVLDAVAKATAAGNTPLARAMCKAVDALVTRVLMSPPDSRMVMLMHLETDGEENNTPMDDQCGGPPSTLLKPPFSTTPPPPSWQALTYQKVCTLSTNPSGSGDACAMHKIPSLIVDIDQIFSSITMLTSSAPNREPANRSRTGLAAATIPPGIDAAFFSTLTHDTQGTYTSITAQSPTPIPGDTNHDGCVDILDRSQVLQDFGTRGNGSDDFNHDLVVDILDLSVVQQHFGQCVQP